MTTRKWIYSIAVVLLALCCYLIFVVMPRYERAQQKQLEQQQLQQQLRSATPPRRTSRKQLQQHRVQSVRAQQLLEQRRQQQLLLLQQQQQNEPPDSWPGQTTTLPLPPSDSEYTSPYQLAHWEALQRREKREVVLSDGTAKRCIANNRHLHKCASQWSRIAIRAVVLASSSAASNDSTSSSTVADELENVSDDCRGFLQTHFSPSSPEVVDLAGRFAFEFVGDSVTRGLFGSFIRSFFSRHRALPRRLKRFANQDRRGPVYSLVPILLNNSAALGLVRRASSTNPLMMDHESMIDTITNDNVERIDIKSDLPKQPVTAIQCTSRLRVPLRDIQIYRREVNFSSDIRDRNTRFENSSEAEASLRAKRSPFLRTFFRFDGLYHLLQSPRVNVARLQGGDHQSYFSTMHSAALRKTYGKYVHRRVPPWMWRSEGHLSSGHHSHDDLLTNGAWPKVIIHTNIHTDIAVARFLSDALAERKQEEDLVVDDFTLDCNSSDDEDDDYREQEAAARRQMELYSNNSRDNNSSDFLSSHQASASGKVDLFATNNSDDSAAFLNKFEEEQITAFLRVTLNFFKHTATRRNTHLFILLHTIQDCDSLARQDHFAARVFKASCPMFYVRSFQLKRLRAVLREEILRAAGHSSDNNTDDDQHGDKRYSQTLEFIRTRWNSTTATTRRPRDLEYHLQHAERLLFSDVTVAARRFIRETLLTQESRRDLLTLASLMLRTVVVDALDMHRVQHLCKDKNNSFCETTTDSIHPEPKIVEPLERDALLSVVAGIVRDCYS